MAYIRKKHQSNREQFSGKFQRTVLCCLFIFLFFFWSWLAKAAGDHLLITEVQIAGESFSNDFIKIYNPTDSDIYLGNFNESYIRLVKRAKTSTKDYTVKSWFREPEAKIPAKGYYLWANNKDGYDLIVGADSATQEIISENNGIALRLGPENTGAIIDAVGWGDFNNLLFEELSFIENPVANQKLERKKSAGVYQDTDNNSQDFFLNPPLEETLPAEESPATQAPQGQSASVGSQPAHQNNPPIADAGQDKISLVGQEIEFDGSLSSDPDNDSLIFFWNFGQGRTAETAKATSTYPYPGNYTAVLEVSDGFLKDTVQILVAVYPTKILISEFLADPESKDEEGEWFEIYNSSNFWIDLGDWQLDDEEGGSKPFTIPANTFIKPKNYLVFSRPITKIALNNDKDSIRILFPNGEISDEVQYQDNKEALAGARKGDKIFWTEVLTPGSANFIYFSSETSSQKESFLPQVNQSTVESLKNKETTSFLGERLPNLVIWPKIADFDNLSLLPEIALAKKDQQPRSDLGSDRGQNSAVPAKFTAGLSDKLNQPLVILLSSVILSSFLFGLSLASWRRKLKSKES